MKGIFYPSNNVLDGKPTKNNKELIKYFSHTQDLSNIDIVIPDNTNAMLINPVEFNTLELGDNSKLIIMED